MAFLTVFQHEGQEIGVTAYGTFEAPDEQSFKTLEEAKVYVHQQALEERAAVVLNREVITDRGTRLTVRRIHSGNGTWLTAPVTDTRYARVFRPSEAVTELLAAKVKLNTELKVIQDQLDERGFQLSSARFRGDKAERITEMHQEFLDWYDSQDAS